MPDQLQLFPGQRPPLAVVTPIDQRGIIWIATFFCLAASIVSLLIRAYVRIEFSQSYGKDDISIAGAFTASVIQSALVIYAAAQGLGRTLSDVASDDLASMQKSYYTSDLFFIITLWITKFSVLLLLSRLTSKSKDGFVTKIITGMTAVLGVASFLMIALNCQISSPWIFVGRQCSGKTARWEVVAVFDILTELAIFANLFSLIAGVQLRASQKMVVILGFAFRLLMLPIIAVRLHYIIRATNSSDQTLKLSDVAVLTELELVVAIVSATVPCLRPFMAATYTTWGGRVDTVSGSGSGYHSRVYASGRSKKNNSKEGTKSSGGLRSLRLGVGSGSKSHTDTRKSQDDIALEPVGHRAHSKDHWSNAIDAEREDPDDHGSAGMPQIQEDQQSAGSQEDSQKLIIRRDLEWTVHHEDRPEHSGGRGHALRGV